MKGRMPVRGFEFEGKVGSESLGEDLLLEVRWSRRSGEGEAGCGEVGG